MRSIVNTFYTTLEFFMSLESSPLHTSQSSYEFIPKMDAFYCSWSSFHVYAGRFSVGCLKRNGALQHLEIQIIMDVYQTVLANRSPNNNVFWAILMLSKSRKID